MATPQEIETAAQFAAEQLTADGKFDHSSSKIKAACGVENPSANGFSSAEKQQVVDIVTDRLEQAKQIVATLPAIKESRDKAIEHQNAASSLTKDYLADKKFAQQELGKVNANSPEGLRYADQIQQNDGGLELTREREREFGGKIDMLDDQMKRVTQSALGAAVKGDPTDASIDVKKGLAEKAAKHAAPKESNSMFQSIKSKFGNR